MKKIILFVFLISCFMFKPIMEVSADAASPVITLYDAIVTNPKGAKAYINDDSDYYEFIPNEKADLIISYNSEVIVLSEFQNITALIKYKNTKYVVDLNDINPKGEEYEFKNAVHYDTPRKAISVKNFDIYNGPSESFKKVGSVPNNIEITYEYAIENTDGYEIWVFVSYNGKEGWVQVQDGWRNKLALTP